MLGAPAGLDEVINYADFKKETSVESLEDQATLDDSPDKQEIQSLLSGNITINGSRIVILQGGKKRSYCLSLFSTSFFYFLSAGLLLIYTQFSLYRIKDFAKKTSSVIYWSQKLPIKVHVVFLTVELNISH